MEKDFYLNERGFAACFEKDWLDHVQPREIFAFPPFEPFRIYCDYHEKVVQFLTAEIQRQISEPKNLLEIGSSLGRTFFEICSRTPSLREATLVEPSKLLYDGFQRIFAGAPLENFPVVREFSSSTEVTLPTEAIQSACRHVKVTSLNQTFQDLRIHEKFDLVICSNVIDQCSGPRDLAEVIKAAAAPGGLVLLSCTYQWQHKFTGNAVRQIRDIKELFGPGWRCLNEMNYPFHSRVNERHWLAFLSHVGIFQKV